MTDVLKCSLRLLLGNGLEGQKWKKGENLGDHMLWEP